MEGQEQAPATPIAVAPARELLSFAASRPGWQQHLIRCLYVDGEATPQDLEDAYQMLLADHGAAEAEPLRPKPLMASDVPPSAGPATTPVLHTLGPLSGVNRLVDDQVLPFATDGLTVIYGENATGKSGYVRVLKKLCRAHATSENILPDVSGTGEERVAQGHIRFSVDGQVTEATWRQGDDPPDQLATVSVFDSRRAPLYSDGERRLEFLPAGLDVLGKLGELLLGLAGRCDSEIAALRRTLPTLNLQVPPTTQVGWLVARLADERNLPTREELEGAATLTPADEKELAELEAAFASDPVKTAARWDRLATALTNMAARVDDVDAQLGDASLEFLRSFQVRVSEARAAVQLAATRVLAADSPLSSVGSDPWRLMFRYAREYSGLAYPGEPFPPSRPDARCPLCQQLLTAEAADRLRHFSEFVAAAAEQEAARLEAELATRLETIRDLAIPSATDVETMVAAVEPLSGETVTLLRSVLTLFTVAGRRRDVVLGSPLSDVPDEALPEGMSGSLRETATRFAETATRLRAVASDTDRQAAADRLQELQARRQLARDLPNAHLRLDILKRVQVLSACRRACDTGAVSRKNSELRRAFLTADFQRRLAAEFTSLDLEHLPLRVSERSDRGQSLISVALDTELRVPNRQVLSEGELGALALACFLAEVASVPVQSPIVLDDPVSSLDHVRIERVARRLVSEARSGRQVIIFTHNLVFFHELWMKAAEARVPTATHWLAQSAGQPGLVKASEQPWDVQGVKTRLGELDKRLAAARRVTDQTSDDYRAATTHFYTGLRETWERLVEEQLFGEVVERFRLGVETKSLRVVEVTDDDYAKVFFAMTRVSQFSGHDRAIARQLVAPSPDEMSQDLTELRAYHGDLRKRAARLSKQRAARHAPPQGQIELGA